MITVLLTVAACSSAQSDNSDRSGPLALTESDLAAAEAYFAPIAQEGDAFARLRASGDSSTSAVRSFVEEAYSPDVVFHDETFGDHHEGHDDVTSMYQLFLSYFSEATIEDRPTLIGDPTALQVIPFWDMTLGPWEFTQAEPLIEVDLIEVDKGRVGSLLLYYDLASLQRMQGDRPDLDGSLQEDYAVAWTTESAADVADLYTEQALRHDGLGGVDASGRQAILAEAERWFEDLAGATWTVQLPFGETSAQQVGGIFSVDHQGCPVTIGILFDLDEDGLITQERLHYDPATLRACGWVD
jgi:ketosteroid isomerase-like protein